MCLFTFGCVDAINIIFFQYISLSNLKLNEKSLFILYSVKYMHQTMYLCNMISH